MPSPTRRTDSAPALNFTVTPDIINQSIPRNSSHCMIADALKAAMPNAEYVSVDLATIRFTDRTAGRRYIYLTPRNAQLALIDFDEGRQPEPFKVKARAAQMVHTGAARKAKKIQDEAEEEATGTPKPKRRRAQLVERPPGATDGIVPIKVGGNLPPLGPLAEGMTGNQRRGGRPPGMRREFGIHALIR
jgi:hypothetical protein